MYSHQESPLAHLIWTKYNVDFFVFFGVVCFHTTLLASEPETVNKTTHAQGHPFIGSSIQPYQRLLGTGPRPPLQLGLGTVVWSTPECDCCIHTCPKDPHQGGETNLTSTQSNQTREVWIHPERFLFLHWQSTQVPPVLPSP